MPSLPELLRRRLPEALWARAQAWVDAGAVRRAGTSWVVAIPGGQRPFTVELYPEDGEWACSCELEVCAHAAAAALAAATGRAAGQAATVRYVLERHAEGLAFVRHAPADAARLPADSELNRILGGWWGRPTVPRGLVAQALEALSASACTYEGRAVRCDGRPVPPRILVEDHPKGREAGFQVRMVRAAGIDEAFANGAVRMGDVFRPIATIDLDPALHQRLLRGEAFPPGEVERLVTRFLPDLRRLFPVEVRTERLPEARQVAPQLAWEVHGDAGLRVVARIVYGDPPLARVERGQLVRIGGPVVIRDPAAERRLEEQLLAESGMVPGLPVERAGAAAPTWAEGLRGQARERVFGALPSLRIDRSPIVPEVGVTSVGDQLQVHVQAGGASGAALLDAWEGKESLVFVGDRWRPVPRAWLERNAGWLAELLSAADREGKIARNAAPMVLEALQGLDAVVPAELHALKALAGDFEAIPAIPVGPTFRATLRPYQERGLAWIAWLRTLGMGGVLADDMGLGKTVQCLAAVDSLRLRTLVVCPTSVLQNWASEAAKFAPSRRVCVYHGPRRVLDPRADLVVTSWALLRLDTDALLGPWDLAVFDEAQAIKNPESQVAQAARRVEAAQKLAVTGTPVENRLDELWSLFHLVNPGLLGGRRAFRDQFEGPVAQGSRVARDRLRRRIRPFLMRRLKREVARELPPRTDVVLRCTLTDEERQAYEAAASLGRADVAKLLEGGGYLQVLEVLLRMRQAACHPGLLGRPVATSSKVELLLEELDEILADPTEGHRALVFSQWTSLLDLVEPHLRARGIRFVRLDGSTRDRAAVVAAFNAEDGPPVFLLSLTAGGTGLNLVAADYVFLLDPWWNPAVEDQATDRAHRIGQTRPVVACRLIAEDSVEERILALQAHKRGLAAAALDDAALARGLARDDLLSLFE